MQAIIVGNGRFGVSGDANAFPLAIFNGIVGNGGIGRLNPNSGSPTVGVGDGDAAQLGVGFEPEGNLLVAVVGQLFAAAEDIDAVTFVGFVPDDGDAGGNDEGKSFAATGVVRSGGEDDFGASGGLFEGVANGFIRRGIGSRAAVVPAGWVDVESCVCHMRIVSGANKRQEALLLTKFS